MDSLLQCLPLLGRIFVGFYFAFFGFWNIYHWTRILKVMAENGIPHPYIWLQIGILWQIVAGTMIIVGMYDGIAAITLIPFTLIAICMFYPFWKYKGELFILNFTIFMTQLTVTLGALLLLVSPYV